MIQNELFRKELAKISAKEQNRYDLMYRVSSNLARILKRRGMTQREFAKQMGRTEQEVGRWLGGFHNFTLATIADISFTLKEDVLSMPVTYIQTQETLMVAETARKYIKD